MTRVRVLSVLLVAGAVAGTIVAGTACKGETVYKDNPDTLDKMSKLQQQIDSQKQLIQQLTDQTAQCQRNGGAAPGEIVVSIEGDAVKIKPGHGGGGAGLDDATTAKESQAFLDMVQKSRGAIQKCYEQALKKNTGLQARTISLAVSASFSSTGAYQQASFAPSLGDTFDNCMKTIATKWALPTNSPAMTFKATVSLTPS